MVIVCYSYGLSSIPLNGGSKSPWLSIEFYNYSVISEVITSYSEIPVATFKLYINHYSLIVVKYF
jgi:hypothetical protein